MNAIFNNKVSYFNSYDTSKPAGSISIQELFQAMKEDGDLEESTNSYRSINNPKTKMNFDTVTWATDFNDEKRNNNSPASFSGIIYCDIDDLEKDALFDIKEKLKLSPYVVSISKSISGNGLRVLFHSESSHYKHKNAFQRYLLSLGVESDSTERNHPKTALNIISYDKDIWINDKPTSFTKKSEKKHFKLVDPSKSLNIKLIKNEFRAAFISSFRKSCNPVFSVNEYTMNMIKYKVSLDNTISLILTQKPNLKQTSIDTIKKLYCDYAFLVESDTKNKKSNKMNVHKHIILKENQYISDLNLTWKDLNNKILVAPTNTGKTEALSILPGPTINVRFNLSIIDQQLDINRRLIEQTELEQTFVSIFRIADLKKAKTQFTGNEKSSTIFSSQIETTPQSFRKLMFSLIKENPRCKFNLVVDEYDKLVRMGSADFAAKTMTSFISALEDFSGHIHYKTFLSGTPQDIRPLSSLFQELEMIKISKEVDISKQSIITTLDNPASKNNNILMVAKNAKANKDVLTVLLNDKNIRLDTIQKMFKQNEINLIEINATTLDDAESLATKVIASKTIPEEFDGVIITNASDSGINLLSEAENETIIVIDGHHWDHDSIIQSAGRQRKVKSKKLFSFVNDNFYGGFMWKNKPVLLSFEERLRIAEDQCRIVKTLYSDEKLQKVKSVISSGNYNYNITRLKNEKTSHIDNFNAFGSKIGVMIVEQNGSVVPWKVAMLNFDYEKEFQEMREDAVKTEHYYTDHGWEVIHFNQDELTSFIEQNETNKEVEKPLLEKVVAESVDSKNKAEIIEHTEKHNTLQKSMKSQRFELYLGRAFDHKFEIDTGNRMSKEELIVKNRCEWAKNNIQEDPYTVLTWLEKHANKSDRAWSIAKSQVEVYYEMQYGSKDDMKMNLHLQVLKSFKVGESYDSAQINYRINNCLCTYFGKSNKQKIIDVKDSLDIFDAYFKRKLVQGCHKIISRVNIFE